MKHKFRYALMLLLVMALAFPLTAQAKALPDGKVIMGGSYTLEAGERLDGDLVVFGGSVTIEDGATVYGDVALFGGALDVAGTVQGDVVAFGGVASLTDTAYVSGNLVTFGGRLNRAEGAVIGGEVVSGQNAPFDFTWQYDTLPYGGVFSAYSNGPLGSLTRLFFRLMWFLFQVFTLSALAVLALMFLESPVQRITEAAQSQPALSGGVGCLTLAVVPPLLFVLALTVLLLPVSVLGLLALVLLALYGWVAMGYEVGRRVAEGFGQTWGAPIAAGVGTFILSLVVGGVGKAIPCVGWLLPLAAAGLGLGAVILTQLGSKPYPPEERFPAPALPAGEPEPPQADSAPEEPPPPPEGPEEPAE